MNILKTSEEILKEKFDNIIGKRRNMFNNFHNESKKFKHQIPRINVHDTFISEDLKPEISAKYTIKLTIDFESSLPKVTVSHICERNDPMNFNFGLKQLGETYDEDDDVQCDYKEDVNGNQSLICSKSASYRDGDDFPSLFSVLTNDIEGTTNFKDQCF